MSTGRPSQRAKSPGDVSNWDEGFRLALGNELTGDRPWLGELHRVAVYAKALDSEEIGRSAKAGYDAKPDGPVALYDFREGTGRRREGHFRRRERR